MRTFKIYSLKQLNIQTIHVVLCAKRKKIQEIVIKIMRNRTGYELASNENF